MRAWVLHPDTFAAARPPDPGACAGRSRGAGRRAAGARGRWAPRSCGCRSRMPGLLFGAGKIAELKAKFAAEEVDLVLVDGPVSPVQQRNLEKEWGLKLLDRTGLILEIFSDRARTREGVLAGRDGGAIYQRTRLVRAWTHLERQRGGLGFRRRPRRDPDRGDRRAIDDQILKLKRQLAKVAKTREPAPRRAGQGAVSDRRAGGLHQRRQIHAVQPADRGRGAGQGHAVRHPRSDDARRRPASAAEGDPQRYRGLHLGPADRNWWRRSGPRWKRCSTPI